MHTYIITYIHTTLQAFTDGSKQEIGVGAGAGAVVLKKRVGGKSTAEIRQ